MISKAVTELGQRFRVSNALWIQPSLYSRNFRHNNKKKQVEKLSPIQHVDNETDNLIKLEQAECEAAHRAAVTPEQSQARRRRHAEYLASQRATETPKQSQARRLQHATYMASQRDTETIEEQMNFANVLLLKGHNNNF
ncbi:hypothetical protein TNCV_2866701 [Trichonephila clavipes]|nr:hypothetical protein TNCV_2866701 [Trichonephila clavipes]